MGKKKFRRNRLKTTKRTPRERKPRNRFKITVPVILVVLIGMPATGYYYITATHASSSNYLSGIDILSDCAEEISATVLVNGDFDDESVQVMMAIENAKEVVPKCKSFSFVLPPKTSAHHFMLPTIHEGKPIEPDRERRVKNAQRLLGDVSHNDLGNDILMVDLANNPDFTGNIGFNWQAGVQQLSYSTWRLRVPFGAVRVVGDDRKGAKEFHVSMALPGGYVMREKSVEPSAQRALEDSSLYSFTIDNRKTVLDITIENEGLLQRKERIRDICLLALGVGVAAVIAELTMLSTKQKA